MKSSGLRIDWINQAIKFSLLIHTGAGMHPTTMLRLSTMRFAPVRSRLQFSVPHTGSPQSPSWVSSSVRPHLFWLRFLHTEPTSSCCKHLSIFQEICLVFIMFISSKDHVKCPNHLRQADTLVIRGQTGQAWHAGQQYPVHQSVLHCKSSVSLHECVPKFCILTSAWTNTIQLLLDTMHESLSESCGTSSLRPEATNIVLFMFTWRPLDS